VYRKDWTGVVTTLRQIGTELSKIGEDKLPDNVRQRLIHEFGYGPAEARLEMDMSARPKTRISDEQRITRIVTQACNSVGKLLNLQKQGRLNYSVIKGHVVNLRMIAEAFKELADLVDGKNTQSG
jgi:hypothetical protein